MTSTSLDISAARSPAPGGIGAALRRHVGDPTLARRAAGGDRQAFAAIFARYRDPLFRYCMSILGNREDASDALQAAMMAALQALESPGRQPDQLKPWLYRIAHNESVSLLRRRRPDVTLEDVELQGLADTEELVATRGRLERTFEDIRQLPDGQRGALLMRELSGLAYEEIGMALAMTPAAAKQAVYEARVALHELEEGREMRCQDARETISAGDGRRLRGRHLSAHLRSCGDCAAFRDVMRARQSDFAALPPLPGVAAAGVLASLFGGGGGGSGGGIGAIFTGAGQAIGVGAASKAAAVVAAGAIAAGAGGITVTASGGSPAENPANDQRRAAQPSGDHSLSRGNRDKDARSTTRSDRSRSDGHEGRGARHAGDPKPAGIIRSGTARTAAAGGSAAAAPGRSGVAASPGRQGQPGLGIAGANKPSDPSSTGSQKAEQGQAIGEKPRSEAPIPSDPVPSGAQVPERPRPGELGAVNDAAGALAPDAPRRGSVPR